MEVKTTKTEFRELLSILEKAAAFINEKSTRPKDFDLARRLIRAKSLMGIIGKIEKHVLVINLKILSFKMIMII